VAKVVSGFQFLEGPTWWTPPGAAKGQLLFSDVPASRIHALVGGSSATVFRSPSGNANGLHVDAQGRLLACEGGNHRLTVTQGDGTVKTLAQAFNGKQLNGPNDVVAKKDGNLYFSDPKWAADPNNRQPFQGVFRVDAQGRLALVASDMTNPNGVALSADEKVLYVDDDQDNYVRRYALASDGTPSAPTRFVGTSRTPDGMTTDDAGNLYVATEPGVEVFSPAGQRLGLISVPEAASNCAFGGEDRRTLYITARTSLYATKLNVPGRP
jgi:gluconolactonase